MNERALLGGLLAAATVLAAGPARADAPVQLLVLRERGVGSAAQAQPYVDRFVALAAKKNGWPSAKGTYVTTREAAEGLIAKDKPAYGIATLAAFLALRTKHSLEPLGRIAATRAGGTRYHLVSRSAADLAGCKGKKFASDHAEDVRFVDRVISGGAFKVADFTLVPTKRPVQTIRKVALGEVDCALIDDAQLADLAGVEEAKGVRSVWASAELPAMVVAAFPSSPAPQRQQFRASLGKLCEGEGKAACDEVGIQAMTAITAAELAPLLKAYGD